MANLNEVNWTVHRRTRDVVGNEVAREQHCNQKLEGLSD